MLHRVISQLFPKERDSLPKPSRDTTASIAQNPPLNDIPRNILAFRTITKLLSLIQQERAFRALQTTAKGNQRLQLKLTNALSTLAVIEHEVVAVVNNLNCGMLDLIAYVEPSNKNPRTTPSESSTRHWKVLFSQNYRFRDPNLNSPPPNRTTHHHQCRGLG